PEKSTFEMHVPAVGESINEVTIAQWLKNDGEAVSLDEVIAEIESDKATFELTAETAGILHIKAKQGETLEIGALLCTIESDGSAVGGKSEEPKAEQATSSSKENSSYAAGHASPAAAKILDEKNVDSANVKGTGRDGRITKEDALGAQKQQPAASSKSEAAKPKPIEAAPQNIAASGNRNQRREKLSSLRKTVSRRLVSVKNETAMLTTFNEVDMKPIMELRKKYKEQFKEKYDVNLGFMSFFAKAICVALQEWPAVNAFIDGDEMIYNDFCDISIAVSAPKGLVVP
ncbi:MAG: 2-oxo acid dehydrogenase subunit E2, partial [Bacteroidota bacterium]|nr:2-oxo acid dehydrogenase subunit E2 [Bacteroidota bacterium]